MLAEYRIRKEAIKFREANGVGLTDPINLKSLLLKRRILTLFRPLNGNFSGMAMKTEGLYFMLINSNHAIGRQNFTILHELYHLLIQDTFAPIICHTAIFDKKDKEEYAADIFASHVLLPEEAILERVPVEELGKKNSISLGTILEIEHSYSCSRSSLVNRLLQMKLLDSQTAKIFKKDIVKNARMYGYDSRLYRSGNDGLIIGDYGKKAYTLFDNEIISESHFMSLMSDIGIDLDTEGLNPHDEEN